MTRSSHSAFSWFRSLLNFCGMAPLNRNEKRRQRALARTNSEPLEARQLMTTLTTNGVTGHVKVPKELTQDYDQSIDSHSVQQHAQQGRNAQSTDASGQLVGAPSFNSFSATAISDSQVVLRWNRVSGAQGYIVAMWENGAWRELGRFSGNTSAVTVSQLQANTTYYLDVGAYDQFGVSWANYESATTRSKASAPSAPDLSASANSSKQVQLSWDAVQGASSYVVAMWRNNQWEQIGKFGAGTTRVNVNGLTAGTKYYFCVGGSNAVGTSWSDCCTVTTKGVGTSNTQKQPLADVSYSVVRGSLFGSSGPQYTDVDQGNLGNCWLLSSFAAVAARYPNIIRSMITPAGSVVQNGQTVNLYKVRFYDQSGTARYLTVDNRLPGGGNYYERVENGVLWASLAEKAYALANGLGYVKSQSVGVNSYKSLEGGLPTWALQAITGWSSEAFYVDPDHLASAWASGKIICLGTSANPGDSSIAPGHAYAIVGYNSSSSSPFLIYNPWGDTEILNGKIGQYFAGAFRASTSLLTRGFLADFICGDGRTVSVLFIDLSESDADLFSPEPEAQTGGSAALDSKLMPDHVTARRSSTALRLESNSEYQSVSPDETATDLLFSSLGWELDGIGQPSLN